MFKKELIRLDKTDYLLYHSLLKNGGAEEGKIKKEGGYSFSSFIIFIAGEIYQNTRGRQLKEPSKKKNSKEKTDAQMLAGIRKTLEAKKKSLKNDLAKYKEIENELREKKKGSDPTEPTAETTEIETSKMITRLVFQLKRADEALKRITTGTYGTCKDCNKKIPLVRLEILPFAERCVACAKLKEKAERTRQ